MGVTRLGLLRELGSAKRERGAMADFGVLGGPAPASWLVERSLATGFAAGTGGLHSCLVSLFAFTASKRLRVLFPASLSSRI